MNFVKAAGVPIDSPYLLEAAKENNGTGTPVKMSASWFAEIAQIPIIGITGTRGKSTVTHMLEHIFAMHAGFSKKVLLGGNVRGVSTLALLSEASSEHIGLFELDSWQLQGFGDAQISPFLSAFTTFYPDHLNYYHGDLDAYLKDKAQIFLNQKPEDTLVLGSQCAQLIQNRYGSLIKSRVVIAGEGAFPPDWQLQIPGEHNRYNAALALVIARVEGVPNEVSRTALESFTGVPGRLHLVRTINGIQIYNDNNSTTPDATLVALKALKAEDSGTPRILLIPGGADKGLEMGKMIEEIHRSTKRVILLAGTGTDQIKSSLPEAEIYDNLAMAIADARAHADSGDVILFSPAFASFGMFTNEYDRGDRFVQLINEIQE